MSIVSYSQNFEDVMLWRALGHIERGLYIDIGAQDPVVDSVSLAFHEHGWRGVHVEPTPHYAELLKLQRPGDKIIQAAVGSRKGILPFFEIPHTGISTADAAIAEQHRERGFDIHEISVSCITLATVFKACKSQEIHWLKIDVEGFEEQVLRSWGAAKARPWIVVVESTLPLTQTESHASWEAQLLERDYSAIYFDGLNRYYVSEVHPELKPAFAVPPNVFDAFKLNGTASSTLHQLIEARHQTETSKTLELHSRQQQDLQDEIERLSAGVATLSAAQQIDEAAWAARERELATALQIANTQAEQEKVTLALAHEHHEHALHAEHTRQEAALTQRLKALEGERSALEQEYASRERTLLEQAEGASEKIAVLLQTQAQREHQAQALAEDSRAHLAQSAQRENVLQAQLKIAHQKLRRAQNAAARLIAIYRQATKQKAELAEAYMAEKSQLQRSYAEQENLFKEQMEASGLELVRLQWHAETLKEQHAEAAGKLRGQLEAAEKLHAQRALELTGLMLKGQQQSARENAEQAQNFLLQERVLQRQHADQQGRLTGELKAAQSEVVRLLKYQADREARHAALKDELKVQSDSVLANYAARERALLAQLLSSQQQAEKKKEEQALQHLEEERGLQLQLARLTDSSNTAIQRLRHALEDVGHHLAETQATLTWRATAPLRKLASLLNFRQTPHLNPSKTEQSTGSLEQAQPSPPVPALAEPSPATVTFEQSEHHMPLPEQTTSSSPPPVALTMPELLARYDVDFVECAYRTLLGREPDPEGLSYYLGRLRTGVPKMRMVMQLCESHEGKTHAAKVSGLDTAVRQFRRRERPVLGWFVRQFEHHEGINSVDRQLRALDNQLWLFRNATAERLNRIEHSLAAVHQSVLQQSQSIVADLGGTPNRTSNQTESAAQRSALPEALKQISPRARDIYFQLKTASAIHGGRAV